MDKARLNPLKVACCILFIYAEKEIFVFLFAKLLIWMKFYLSQVLSHILSYLDSQIKKNPSSSSAPISWKGARKNKFNQKKKHWRASLIYRSLYCGGRPNRNWNWHWREQWGFFLTRFLALFSGFLPKVFVKNPFWSFQFEIFTFGYKSSCFYVLVPRLT